MKLSKVCFYLILCNSTLFSIFFECFEYQFRIELWNCKQHEMVITITIIKLIQAAIHGKWIIIHPPLIGVDIVLTSLPENLTWHRKGGGVGEGGVHDPQQYFVGWWRGWQDWQYCYASDIVVLTSAKRVWILTGGTAFRTLN